ncbi:MAG TPA: VanZ family protein [Burkholderiales bacterium]|jgi:VanZ family protein
MPNTVPGGRTSSHEPRTGFSPHSVRLAWILAVAYLLVIGYASLQPFHGWRWPPPEILHFYSAPWPEFITLQDIAVNFAAYIPLGMLLSIGWSARFSARRAALAATLAAGVLSLVMEVVQIFLPARIASNVDLLANTLGALVGAMAAPLLAPAQPIGGRIQSTRSRLFLDGMPADAGLVIVGLWLITQFHPSAQLFGNGALRATLDLPRYFNHTPWLALGSEAAVVMLSVAGVGLMLAALMRDGGRPLPVIGTVIGAALALKLITALAFARASSPLAWLTPGVLLGFGAGSLLLWGAIRLGRTAQLAGAAACIVAATIAINLTPVNPYQSVPPLPARGASHFLNFSGIMRALSELWPLLATGYLVYALGVRRRRAEEAPIVAAGTSGDRL